MAASLKPIDQQVIVITGASSGIGLCTAESASRRGAKLAIAARSKKTLDEIVQRLNAAGGDVLAVTADVGSREQVQQIARAALDRFGRIDTWVNVAGVGIYGRLDQVSDEDSRRLFETNFWGVVNGSLIALPELKKQGGALINVGSEVSEAAVPMLGMYAASKHAVKGFTDSLRIEVEQIDQSPISITLIEPTAVDTPFDEHGKNYMANQPNLPHPMVSPEQVADAILAAAVKPTRYARVGMMAKINTFVSKNLPSVADRMSAKQTKQLQRDEPAHNPDGALWIPSESGQIHGRHAAN